MKIGFIGAGNMASALIDGVFSINGINPNDIYVSNPSNEKLNNLKNKYNLNTTNDNLSILKNNVDILFICVKPQVLDKVLNEIKNDIKENTILVSIVAGKTLDYIKGIIGNNKNIVRVMPNTPCLVKKGVFALCKDKLINENIDKDESIKNKCSFLCDVLNKLGEVIEISEDNFDIATQIGGASPAWLFMIAEAMADGAVYEGMKRDLAYKFIANAIIGSGELLKADAGNPGKLKDMVTSPKGTTIAGVKALEEYGVRAAFMQAVIDSVNRSRNM